MVIIPMDHESFRLNERGNNERKKKKKTLNSYVFHQKDINVVLLLIYPQSPEVNITR